MRKALMALIIFFVSALLFPYEYIMNADPVGIGPLPQANVQIDTLTFGSWDNGYYDLALSAYYQFYYYGKLVTHLRISTNGYIVLCYGSPSGDGVEDENDSIPFPYASPNSMAAPLWADYALAGDPNGGGTLHYVYQLYTDGTRRVIVEWRGVRIRGESDTVYTFSCAFYSAFSSSLANSILFDYADVDTGVLPHDNGASATVGIENFAGTQGEQYSFHEAIVASGQRILFTPFVPIYGSTTDMAGAVTGYPNAVQFRPSHGIWFYWTSHGEALSFSYGTKGDVALPGDYNGDGNGDECVFRPGAGIWFSPEFAAPIAWGTAGDIPVPADYNGDGALDIAVFRPSDGNWYLYYRGSGTATVTTFGTAGDIPLPADYDNDDIADYAVWRPVNGIWFIRKSTDSGTQVVQWGTDGDIPMPGNFNSTSYSTLTLFRPSNGYWFTYNQINGSIGSWQFGQNGDAPLACDSDANGRSDYAIFRPGAGYWFLNNPAPFPVAIFQWGTLGDKPRFRRSFPIVSPPAGEYQVR